jgi:hypothetical protein
MKIKISGARLKRSLLLFSVSVLFFVIAQATILPALNGKYSRVEAATVAENKANARATDTGIPTNCQNISPGNDSFFNACVARFKAYYLGDGSTAPDCPADDGSPNYQYCQDEAPKNGRNQVVKDFPDLAAGYANLCKPFISNAKGGSWPDFSKLNGSEKQKAIDACVTGFASGFVYAPGDYPANEPCQAKYQGQNTLLQACYAGESLADAHLFTVAEVKAIAQSGKLTKTDNGSGGAGGGAGGGGTAPTCESGDFSFNWALCPIFDGTNAVTNWIFKNLIQPLLMTNPICLDPTGTACDNTIYKIWSGFRVYGDIFLVIVLLVIVFGESIGGGMIDTYTAKKILPRLLIAAILINLSVYIVALLIDITNVVGGGIGQLLTAPLGGNGAFKIQPDGITQGAIAAFGATGLLVGGFVLGVTGIALLMVGLIITGAIAMVGIFITLILRQTIILALLLISPVAFSLWCLPNTEQWFKRWWDTLFQMLLVYPMIIVLFAVADVMSYVTQHNGQGGVLSAIVAFMLLIIPLYLVPFTLRSSNRVLGAIHGAVSNVGRQINSMTGRRALAGAGQEANKNLGSAGNYSRFSNRNALTRGINTLTGTVVHPRSMLRGRAGVRAAQQAHQTAHGAESLKDNAIFQANQGDDKFLLAVADRELAQQKLAATRQKYEDARARGDTAGMVEAQSTIDAQQHALDTAAQLGATGRSRGVQYQALQSLAKTGFQFQDGAAGYEELSNSVRKLSGGDERAYASMMNESQYNLRTAGRFDLGGINDGAGYDPRSGTDKASLYELANAKPSVIQGMMEGVDMSATTPSTEHAVLYKELQAMLPNAKGATRDRIIENVQHLEDFGIKDYMRQTTGSTRQVRDRSGKTVTVNETNDDIAQREARTYERPDPNHIT